MEFEVQGIMLKVAPVSTKNLSFVNSSVRKISPALVGKCIAMAVACAGMAAEPERVRRHFSFPRKYRVQYTCVLYSNNNYETCTCHWKDSEKRVRQPTFGKGFAVPFVACLPASGSRAPTSVSRGGRDHRVVAASSIPQGV